MTYPIGRVAVIGAGTMGAGIAAHMANAGLEVDLLDLSEVIAAAGVVRQLQSGGFMLPEFAETIRVGSIANNLPRVAEADWIIEAIAEDIGIKRRLYESVQGLRRPGAIVSSNTSTIPVVELARDMAPGLAQHFLVTHFFNPPRQMRLLELVAGPDTKPEIMSAISQFADHRLGKQPVMCRDTPGFIANRIGCYWLAAGLAELTRGDVAIDAFDAAIARGYGIPSTGLFGLLDLIGIDVSLKILKSLETSLPPSDALHPLAGSWNFLGRLAEAGRMGRKSGAGFYRQTKGQPRQVIDMTSLDYMLPQSTDLHSEAAASADRVMIATLAYTASLLPEIADTPSQVDAAMTEGYGWSSGPFRLIDMAGPGKIKQHLSQRGPVPASLARADAEGGYFGHTNGTATEIVAGGERVPLPRVAGVQSIAELHIGGKLIRDLGSIRLWDMGVGVAGMELTTKLGTMSSSVHDAMDEARVLAEGSFGALVIGSDNSYFSAGANLSFLCGLIEEADFSAIDAFIQNGQRVFSGIKYSSIPTVAAVSGIAVGGGCELALHCSAIQAHAECRLGLVEARIGLVPAWGGCKELLARLVASDRRPDTEPANSVAFDLVARSATSGSAIEARRFGYLRATDGITMNRARLLQDAHTRAIQAMSGYGPRQPFEIALAPLASSKADQSAIDTKLRAIFDGNGFAVNEKELLYRERSAFMELVTSAATIDKVRAMLR